MMTFEKEIELIQQGRIDEAASSYSQKVGCTEKEALTAVRSMSETVSDFKNQQKQHTLQNK